MRCLIKCLLFLVVVFRLRGKRITMLLIWLYLCVFDDLVPKLQEYSAYLKEKRECCLSTPPDYITLICFRKRNQLGEVVWCNNEFRRLGICPAVLNNDGWQNIIHPDDVDIMNERIEIALGGETYQGVHRLIIDGRIRWLYNYTIPIRDEGLIYLLSYNYDITHQVALDKFLAKLPIPYQPPPSLSIAAT